MMLKWLLAAFWPLLWIPSLAFEGECPFVQANFGAAWGKDTVEVKLDSLVTRLAQERKCRVVLRVGYGVDRRYYVGYDGRRNQRIEKFDGAIDIGSQTKMFTAISVLQLIERGKLSLETPLVSVISDRNLISDLVMKDHQGDIDSVRIRHLLNHSSGFPDYFYKNDDIVISLFSDSTMRFTPRQLIQMAKRVDTAKFRPGHGFSYSNVNYLLLGMIIEKISGKSYYEYVRENIFLPAGLSHSGFASSTPPDRRSAGYFNGRLAQMPATMAGAAGEIVSTLDDMDRFIRFWEQGKLYQNNAIAEVQRRDYFLSMGGGLLYGLGIISMRDQNRGHAGQTFGYSSYTGIFPNGYSMVLAIDDAAVSVWLPAMDISNALSSK